MKMIKSLLFAATSLATVLGAFPIQAQDLPLPLEPLPGDVDGDGIADGADNCRSRYNPEQMDFDQDRRGDECDVTLVTHGPLNLSVAAGRASRPRPIADLYNNTGRPVAYTAMADSPLVAIRSQGAVEPGGAFAIRANFLTGDLQAGESYTTNVEIVVQNVRHLIAVTILVLGSDEPEICRFEINMYKVRVSDGQGVVEGKLELDLTGRAGADCGSASIYKKLAESSSWSTLDHEICTEEVEEGSPEEIFVSVDIDSNDSGATGAADEGSQDGTLVLECGGGTASETLTVDLEGRALAEDDGEVKVVFYGFEE